MTDSTSRSGPTRTAARAGAVRAKTSTGRGRTERGAATTSPADASAAVPTAPVEAPASPLDVQLATMRALFDAAKTEGRIENLDLARQACDIAKLAAPYVHARLGTAEVAPEGSVRHEDVLDLLD
jgi:hypothetical protein